MEIKSLIILFVIIISGCNFSPFSNNDGYNETKEILAYGDLVELNQLNPDVEKNLSVRLYKKPLFSGDCFKETQGLCHYALFVSVSSYDEYPEYNMYPLDFKGEFVSAKWLPTERVDYAEIEIKVKQYTEDAIRNNTTLPNDTSIILLKLGLSGFEEHLK